MPELSQIAESLKAFGGNPQKATPLVSILGFKPEVSPENLLGKHVTPLVAFFNQRTDRFGVLGLYRVGSVTADPGTAGLYVAVVNQWGERPHERDRARRRIARALVEHQQDSRSLFIMVQDASMVATEAEFVLPRAATEGKGQGPVATIRAAVDLMKPTRFHRELLAELALPSSPSLRQVSEHWQKAFSVERVTKVFYQQYASVRDKLAEALKTSNPGHPFVKEMSEGQRHAWATRQMGRILFLWFLQSKRWLGYDGSGQGSMTYLLDLWPKRSQAIGGYYAGLLTRLFFEGMALKRPGKDVRDLLGQTPYLNGGLFRKNKLEYDVEAGGPVSLPDEVFDPNEDMTVLGLFSRYRFTTRESTPDDQSIDPDPELLGRVFENLYQGDERHDSGTYYTPREIVHFMCRQVLDGYLRDMTGAEQDIIDKLRRTADEPEEGKLSLEPILEEKFVQALEGVRVCDLAVGSGAFLLGMMHEIVQLRRGMWHTKQNYADREEEQVEKWKRRAIQGSLYGVDINPEAVDICQLRLWLSLVLDHDDPHTFDPLPNLDFRVVAGDSLVDRAAGISFSGSLPQGAYKAPLELQGKVGFEQRRIEQWKREFEGTQEDPGRLKELRDNIANAQNRIIRYQLEAELGRAKEEAQYHSGITSSKKAAQVKARVTVMEEHLKRLVPDAPYQKPFLWPVSFFEVFEPPSSGFDIVLANPPYVRQEKLDSEDQESYMQAFPEVYSGTADLLVFFYARALQILRDGGWLSFITSNKYMRAGYGEGLRGKLAGALNLQRVIDFGDLPLFETGDKPVAAYPAVLVGKRNGGQPRDNTLQVADLAVPIRIQLTNEGKIINAENVRLALEGLERLLGESGHGGYPQVLLRKEGWVLEDPALVKLFHQIMEQGVPFGNFVDGKIYRGLTTGLNEAFVIDQKKHDELVAEDQRSAGMIRPWLRGKDIKRWQANWAGLFVIHVPWSLPIAEYPALFRHVEGFKDALEKRPEVKRGIYPWYAMSRWAADYYHEFGRHKIIWPDITPNMRFAWDSGGHFLGNSAYLANGPRWLVSLLNSNVLEFAARYISTAIRGGYLRLIDSNVFPLPIVQPGTEVARQLSVLSEPSTCSSQDEIEAIAAHLYGLDNAQASMLSSWATRIDAASQRDEGDIDD